MPLPIPLIRKISSLLGVPGQHHFSDIPHFRLATDATVWELPSKVDPSISGPGRIGADIRDMRSNDIDSKLAQVRSVLGAEHAIAYKSISWWLDVYRTTSRRIAVLPSKDQFDILPNEQGPAPHSDSKYYTVELRKYDEEYGIDITGAAHQVVEFMLKRIPVGQEAKALSDRMLRFAPDIAQGGFEAVQQIDFERNNGKVALWWD